jgi:hypothetical protein
MEFNIAEWRKDYDKAQSLGKRLKDSQPYRDEDKVWHEAPHPLGAYDQINLQKEIEVIALKISKYLDDCGIRMEPPLWDYDKEDPSTWPSDESFKFKHLLKPTLHIDKQRRHK